MTSSWLKEQLLCSTVIAGFAAAFTISAPIAAYAQDDDVEVEAEDQDLGDADEADEEDRLTVTGSRIRRDSFTSTAPLQVIDSETIAESGLVDIGQILQSTTVVQGVQLDQQVNSQFVTDAGPGGQTVSLRGLGEERTLVLINGRRFAPAGVEGAPSVPDISLIPSSMIDRVDILLDGASSVYGSDAVAGVVNLVLRDEFEGISLEAFRSFPTEEGGDEEQYTFLAGASSDRGRFLVGAEYFRQEEIRGDSRDWMFAFDEDLGRNIAGGIDLIPGENGGTSRIAGTTSGDQKFIASPFGILTADIGAGPAFGLPEFTGFQQWGGTTEELFAGTRELNEDEQITPSFALFSLYAKGDYDLDNFIPGSNMFFEFSMSNRQTNFQSGYTIIDVALEADNPFNIFTPFGGTTNSTLRPGRPWRDELDVELTQYRTFAGLEGDLGFVGLNRWDYELFAGYTRSQGYSSRTVVREEALIRSLQTEIDPATGTVVCSDVPNPSAPFTPGETLEPCIPFNPFDLGLWPVDGSAPRASDERLVDYLRGVRTSTTFVDQWLVGGFATGPLIDLPYGELSSAVGFEWREDSIDTRSDDVTARGLGSGFFLDRPTVGRVELWEVFGEFVIPLVKGEPFIYDLEMEFAGRLTHHEFYGRNSTYSAKLRYAPTDFLTFRGTYGTSFRAPNLRELFLAGQSGFANVNDPCEVPNFAQIDTDGDGQLDTYDPGENNENDGRSEQILNNCRAEGLDPLSLAIGINTGNVETFSAGNTDLDPETSESWSAGFVFEQPFVDWIDARLGFTYWNIDIEGSVFEPSANFLVNECYESPNFPDDPFCTRRQRDPNTGFLSEVDATPFNIAEENAAGFDVNLFLGGDVPLYFVDETVRVELDLVSTYTEEVSTLIELAGTSDFENDAGDIGNPRWRGTGTARVIYGSDFGDWTLFFRSRFIDGQVAKDAGDRPGNCFQPGIDLEFEPCYSIPDVWYHDVSINWAYDTWSIRAGVNNVFDRDPPQIDEDVTVTTGLRSVPSGIGYDRVGRRFFVNVGKSF